MTIRRKHIRDLAERLLAEHNYTSAPINLETIAQTQNAIVHKQPVGDDVSGFLYRNNTKSTAVIGVNMNQSENRQRFTIAHELGHYLLHTGNDVHVDHSFVIKKRDSKSSQGVDVEEIEANLFAAELLMPATFLEHDLAQMDGLDLMDETQINRLANRYRVSVQAMAIRLSALGYLSI